MVYPENMIGSDDLTVISQYTEVYNASGTDITAIEKSFYHVPFLFWVIVFLVLSTIFSRLILEVIISFRGGQKK